VKVGRNARLATLTATALAVAPGCASSAQDAGRTVPSAPIALTSTLAGRTTLPLRIHWVARTSLPAAKVAEVRFLIDHRPAWQEHDRPYVYGDDGNWLVTSFLRPGEHIFTVELETFSGRTTSRSHRARVAAAPTPPRRLAGSWSRLVTRADVRRATSDEPPPAGRWRLGIGRTGWQLRDPQGGGGLFDVAYASRRHLQMRPTIEHPPYPNANNGGFCRDTDPLAGWTFTLSDDGRRLTLAPVRRDPCGDRVAILAGTWEMAGP
jgi:hypothetical protein